MTKEPINSRIGFPLGTECGALEAANLLPDAMRVKSPSLLCLKSGAGEKTASDAVTIIQDCTGISEKKEYE